MAPFQHYPLATPSTIRLVHIPPLKESDDPNKAEIRFGIDHYEMKDITKKYIALSYVWGDTTTLYPIKMGGQEFAVTRNLLYFLRHRRDRTRTLRYWIDALCIDQNNNKEKSQQIPRMREIYENAVLVHAELGPVSDEEERAVDAMKILFKSCFSETNTTQKRVQVNLPHGFFDQYGVETFSAINRIFSHPWWTRAWIMQEATGPTSTSLHLGNKVLRLAEASGANIALLSMTDQHLWPEKFTKLPKLPTAAWNVSRICEIQEQRRGPEEVYFLRVLEAFRGVGATNARDIVYAALNLADDLEKGSFTPDYDQTVASVYRDVPVHFIKTSSIALDVLGYCGSPFQDLDIAKDSASWIPRWNERYPILKLPTRQYGRGVNNQLMYNAAPVDQVVNQGYCVHPPLVDGLTLKVSGIYVDSVAALSLPCLNLDDEALIKIVSHWLTAKYLSVNPSDIIDPDGMYFTGENVMEAFLRTVAIDTDGSKEEYTRGGAATWDHEKSCLAPRSENRHRWLTFVRYRRLALTIKKYMALVAHQAVIGDKIYALFGGTVLYVLRPKGDKFWLAGECYVHGLMDGEIVDWLKDGRVKVEEIDII